MARTPSSSSAAIVRLEVRLGGARPAVYEVGDGGFLVGSVPGCDLRLPGANLAPVICLVARHAGGASLRKLAPVQPITVNGRAVSATYLENGDQIQIGPAEFTVHLTPGAEEPVAAAPPAQAAPAIPANLAERIRVFEEREQQLRKEKEEFDTARILWARRRDDLENECRQQTEKLEQLAAQSRAQEQSSQRGDLQLRVAQEELTRRQAELDARAQTLAQQESEVEELRGEIVRIRQELAQRYQERRETLVKRQEALRRAARKIKKHRLQADEREGRIRTLENEWGLRQAELDASKEQIDRERQLLEDQHRLFASRQQEHHRDLSQRESDLEAREEALAQEKGQLEKGQKQHQADLVRLDRINATFEQKHKQLGERALEIDRKFEQLQRDTRDLEEQAAQMDEWHNRLTAETERLAAQKAEQDKFTSQVEQRAAALEGQQAMLATLRTRLERMREELRRQEQALSDQRALQEASEADVKARLEEAEQVRSDLINDRQLFDEERRRFDERRATLEQAVAQLRQTQQTLAAEHQQVQQRQAQIDATAAEQAEQADLLVTRGEQLEQLTSKLQAERQMMRDREATLTRAEQTLATLQEQVRRRVEELDSRERALRSSEERLAARTIELDEQAAQVERRNQEAAGELEQLRQELAAQAQELVERGGELAHREEALQGAVGRHNEAEESLASQRQALAAERIAWGVERQAAQEHERQVREEFTRARDEGQAIVRGLPELELRASAALERLARAREQLREHLAEVHSYARQSREDLEVARQDLHGEFERVRQQELELQVARDEHRLAVAAFRQQLIDWQGRVGEMRQTLQLGSSQLQMRQAAVEAKAREVEDTSARLAAEAEELERARRVVADRHDEMGRHLGDMREWYRKKLRELAGVDAPPGDEPGEGDVFPMPSPSSELVPSADPDERNPARAVLTLENEVEPADRQMGELLASLELVDRDTLVALWAEARRQRRSLRQLLLAGGYMTLYQMALIEAGNLDGLVLGPVRVIDRLPSTPREAVFRVFDPRRESEAVLRHLAETEMHDAVRPDEFQQRFGAAATVQHSNVAAVLEVLSITGRPAALLEWVTGLPATDWPGLVSAPGVWYRLMNQAALALHAAHSAGLCHGHLDASSFILTPEGRLKLIGLGEPRWLAATTETDADSPEGDLVALGRLATAWAALPAGGKGGKAKPLPEEMQAIQARLDQGPSDGGFTSAQEVMEALEQIGNKVPSSGTAWDRLLRQVRDQSSSTSGSGAIRA